MKTYRLLFVSIMLTVFGVIIGLNGSQVVFLFILAGVIVALFAVRKAQREPIKSEPEHSKSL